MSRTRGTEVSDSYLTQMFLRDRPQSKEPTVLLGGTHLTSTYWTADTIASYIRGTGAPERVTKRLAAVIPGAIVTGHEEPSQRSSLLKNLDDLGAIFLETIREQVVHFPSVGVLKRWLEHHGLPFFEKAQTEGWGLASALVLSSNAQALRPDRLSLPDAYGLLTSGWEGAKERLADLAFDFNRQYRHELQSDQWLIDVTGSEVDVPSYLLGHPEHMFEYRSGQTHRKAINITVDTNTSCGACESRICFYDPPSPQVLFMRGMAVLMLVQQLQRAGYAVTLRTISHAHYPDIEADPFSYRNYGVNIDSLTPDTLRDVPRGLMRTVVTDILRPGEAIDIDAALFALCHESWSRHFDYLVHEYLNLLQDDGSIKYRDGLDDERARRYYRAYSDSAYYAGSSAGPVSARTLEPANRAIVGHVSHSGVRQYLLRSQVKTNADIYIPSPILNRFMLQGARDLLDETSEARKRFIEIYGPSLVLGDSPWGTTEAAANWVFQMLKQAGAVFA